MMIQQDRGQIIKVLLYAAVMLSIYVLETSLQLRIFGLRIDVLPCVALSVALLDGPVEGVILGFLTGMLYDVSYGGAEGLLPLFYMACSGVSGLLSRRYLRRILPSAYLLTACVMLLMGLLQYAYSWLAQRPTETLLFFQRLCGETLMTVVFSTFVYLLVRTISRRYAAPEK